jgi:hypothetical protein
MKKRLAVLALPLGLAIGACGDNPVAPKPMAQDTEPSLQRVRGTGVELRSVTGLEVPLLGTDLGNVVIQQAVVKEFGVVENIAGQVVGLEATGVVELTGGVLGSTVLTEDFTASVGIINSGQGQCNVITVDPAPITVDVLQGVVATVDVPVSNVAVRGSGAVGPLLCLAGRLLDRPTRASERLVRAIVDLINRLII